MNSNNGIYAHNSSDNVIVVRINKHMSISIVPGANSLPNVDKIISVIKKHPCLSFAEKSDVVKAQEAMVAKVLDDIDNSVKEVVDVVRDIIIEKESADDAEPVKKSKKIKRKHSK